MNAGGKPRRREAAPQRTAAAAPPLCCANEHLCAERRRFKSMLIGRPVLCVSPPEAVPPPPPPPQPTGAPTFNNILTGLPGLQDGGPFGSMKLLTRRIERKKFLTLPITGTAEQQRRNPSYLRYLTRSIRPIGAILGNSVSVHNSTANQNGLTHSSTYDVVTSR